MAISPIKSGVNFQPALMEEDDPLSQEHLIKKPGASSSDSSSDVNQAVEHQASTPEIRQSSEEDEATEVEDNNESSSSPEPILSQVAQDSQLVGALVHHIRTVGSPSKYWSPTRADKGRRLVRDSKGTRIGAGAFGQVSKAHTPLRRNRLAMKQGQVKAEIQFWRGVLRYRDIPHIVNVTDSYALLGIAGGALLMEQLDGSILGVLKNRPLSAREIIRIVLQSLETLEKMNGIIHADYKPDNLLVRGAAVEEILLSDFGISRLVGENKSKYVQTTGYRAPEVYFSQLLSEKTDLWGFGATLFKIVTREDLIQLGGFRQAISDSDSEEELKLEYKVELSELMQIAHQCGGVTRKQLQGYFCDFRAGGVADEDIDAYFVSADGNVYFPRFAKIHDSKTVESLKKPWKARLEESMKENPELSGQRELITRILQVFESVMVLSPKKRANPSELLKSFYPNQEICVKLTLDEGWRDSTPLAVKVFLQGFQDSAEIQLSTVTLPETHLHLPNRFGDAPSKLVVKVTTLGQRTLAQTALLFQPKTQYIKIAKVLSKVVVSRGNTKANGSSSGAKRALQDVVEDSEQDSTSEPNLIENSQDSREETDRNIENSPAQQQPAIKSRKAALSGGYKRVLNFH